MDTSDNWASDGPTDDSVTETVVAAMFKERLNSSLMSLDHLLDDGKVDRRALLKASLRAHKKGKATTSAAVGNLAHSMAINSPPSTCDMTSLLYAAAPFSPATSSVSCSTPTPKSRSPHHDWFIWAMHDHVVTFPHHSPPPPLFARFAEEVLGFVWHVLRNPHLKDQPLPPGMCGTSSFEVALAQIIAQTGPPPLEATPTATPRPAEKAVRPLSSGHKAAVPPQPSKKAKAFHPAPPATSATSKKHAPASAIAAPLCRDKYKAPDATLKPAVPPANPLPSSSSRRCQRRKGKHTAHGPSRRGIKVTPPAGSSIHAAFFTPEIIWEMNSHLKSDIGSDVVLESSFDLGTSIFLAASTVPSPSDATCALKHVHCLLPVSGLIPIKADPTSSTSYLKVIDVPLIPAAPRKWQLMQRLAFYKAIALSPVGSRLNSFIKHAPHFMRTSPCSNTCVAWVDISDTVSGTNAKTLISKYVAFGERNCQI
jgi:hypothetical protein